MACADAQVEVSAEWETTSDPPFCLDMVVFLGGWPERAI